MSKFVKGHPGGLGRKPGSRNKATLLREALSEGDRTGIIRAMAKKAKGGDVPAARLMMPYIMPAGTYVKIDLPPVNDAAGIAEAQARVIAETADEKISLETAERFSNLIDNRRRALETVEIDRNLRQAHESLKAREEAEGKRYR